MQPPRNVGSRGSTRESTAWRALLFEAVAGLGNRNAQGEYYLTDIVEIANQKGLRVVSSWPTTPEVMGINTPLSLRRPVR